MALRTIVVVGASLAGLRAAETVRAEGFDGRLVVVGEEPCPPYNRPPLSKAFLTARAVEDVVLEFPSVADLDAEWVLGTRAVALSPRDREVLLAGGATLTYDGLVIATGAAPRELPALTLPSSGVHRLRTVEDAAQLRSGLQSARRVVVIGGGLIGTEVASSCRDLGLDVALVTPDPVLVRVLGPLAASAAARLTQHGVRVHRCGVVAVEGVDHPEAVLLDDGSRLAADVIVVAIGAVPETRWLRGAAQFNDGVICDEKMRVAGLPGVVAAGDVARWPHPLLGGELLRLEHWTNASEQGVAAAKTLLHGDDALPYRPVPSFWSDQFGIRLQGVGLPALAEEVCVVSGDAQSDAFVAEFRRDGALVGAVAANRPRALLAYRQELGRALAALAPT